MFDDQVIKGLPAKKCSSNCPQLLLCSVLVNPCSLQVSLHALGRRFPSAIDRFEGPMLIFVGRVRPAPWLCVENSALVRIPNRIFSTGVGLSA